MASNLSKKVMVIERCISLLGFFYDRLKFLQPATNALVESAAGWEEFRELPFLTACRDALRRGVSFPQAWKMGLADNAGQLGDVAGVLLPLGDTLGSTDLDSQLSALTLTKALLEDRLAIARKYRDQHGRLYRSLGVLCGIAIAIILV